MEDEWTVEYFLNRDRCGVTFSCGGPQSLEALLQAFPFLRKIRPKRDDLGSGNTGRRWVVPRLCARSE